MSINKRIIDNGCSKCNNCKKYLTDYPDLLKEIHPTKNKGINIKKLSSGSSKKLNWICQFNSQHEWDAVIGSRCRGQGCPFCSGKIVTDLNSLDSLYPDIAKEWDYEKNKNIMPKDVSYGTNKKFWWKCEKNKDHSWSAAVSARTLKKSGCLYCCGQLVNHTNSLESLYPDIAKEWDYEKNKIKPSEVPPNSHKEVWWICNKNKEHTWKVKIYNRTSGSGCQKCSNSSYSQSAINWLEKIAKKDNIRIQHAENDGEFRISLGGRKYVKADGYCKETNTIYSYHGCFSHSDQAINCKIGTRYDPNAIHPFNTITFKRVYEKTLEREQMLKDMGYNVVTIWECEDKFGNLRKF